MKLQDLESRTTAQQKQKVLEGHFGQQWNVDNLSTSQARTMLNRVKKLIKEHRSAPQFHRSEHNPVYLKLMVIEQALTSRICESSPGAAPGMAMAQQTPQQQAAAAQSGIRKTAAATGTQAGMLTKAMQSASAGKTLDANQRKAMSGLAQGLEKTMSNPTQATRLQQMLQAATADARVAENKKSRRLREASELQQAQVVLAAQDMVDRVQSMIEDVSSMQFKDLPALVNSIRNDVGMDQAQQFNNDVTAALQSLIQSLQGSKTQLETAQGVLTGQAPVVPGQDAGAMPGAEVPGMGVPGGAGDLEADIALDANLPPEEPEELPAKALGRGRR